MASCPPVRVKSAASQSMPAALALARVLRVTPREALQLLSEARVLPAEFDAATAESTCVALRSHGVEAASLEVPHTTRRCTAHPSLTGEAPCDDCRTLVCPLCLPVCRSCAARRASSARFKRLRVGVLLLVLVGIASWAGLRQRRLDRRVTWARPLKIAVVLVSAQPINDEVKRAWAEGLETLDAWFAGEAQRVGLPLAAPVHFELAPSTVLAEAPEPPEQSGRFLEDSGHALSLRSQLTELAARGNAPGLFDVRLIVALRQGARHLVEGAGEAGGTIGLVEGTAGDTQLTLELTAVAHELLHCLGARDAYDAQGHALPRGLVEPELGFPQHFAEVMVGEVPLAPGQGRNPKSLDEVRVGDETAREVGWLQ